MFGHRTINTYKTCFSLLFLMICGINSFCPDETSCGKNEESKCVVRCPPERSCKTKDALFKCVDVHEVCQSQCVCKKDHFRNAIGECITSEECVKCHIFQHELYTCGGACDNKCSSLDTENRTNCMTPSTECKKQCYCEDGYARDEYKHCVPVKNCNDKCTGPHEYFLNCKQSCPPDECLSIVSDYDCSKQPPCKPGCRCQMNFLRQKPGEDCIPTNECNLSI